MVPRTLKVLEIFRVLRTVRVLRIFRVLRTLRVIIQNAAAIRGPSCHVAGRQTDLRHLHC